MKSKKCRCGWNHTWDETVPQSIVKCRCGRSLKIGMLHITLPWVEELKKNRHPKDRGVGDTVNRLLNRLGAQKFKDFAAKIGIPCKCAQRQEWLNSLWPYKNNTP